MSELHGIDIAINAIKLVVSETDIPIEFYLYGSGSEKVVNGLCSQIRKLDLQNVVKLQDSVPLEKLVSILKNMDVGIVPKRDGKFAGDAISTKLFEFAALGLPAIVSRTRGDSLFFDDSMVLFFEPENERQLADCIIKLFNNPALRRSLSENLRSLHERVNWGLMKSDFYAIYDKLLSSPQYIQKDNQGI